MPRLWSQTIEAHRDEVRQAILDATASLVAEQGMRAVTMSSIAEAAGIGRATLYKYFPHVESILATWHRRQIAAHLARLAEARDAAAGPADQLRAVVSTYAFICHESRGPHDPELAALMHRDDQVAEAETDLSRLLCDVLARAVTTGAVRADVPADELARYCLHALTAASSLPSRAAVSRLVATVLAGLRPG